MKVKIVGMVVSQGPATSSYFGDARFVQSDDIRESLGKMSKQVSALLHI